jgi:hypothetical protein
MQLKHPSGMVGAAAILILVSNPAIAGPLYTFTTIADPDATGSTQPTGINDAGQIVGIYSDGNGTHGFLDTAGVFTTIDYPGAAVSGGNTLTEPLGINSAGQIVGQYFDSTGGHGFVDTGGVFTAINIPGAIQTAVTGINSSGQMVGYYVVYVTVGSVQQSEELGFLYSGGVFTTIQEPPNAINDAGQMVGSFNYGGFLDSGGTFTTFNDPNATGMTPFTDATGINNSGQMVGFFSTPEDMAFVYDGSTFSEFDAPGADTIAAGINDAGQIVGIFNNNVSGGWQGYLATPISLPEPSTLALFGFALAALALMWRRASSPGKSPLPADARFATRKKGRRRTRYPLPNGSFPRQTAAN